MSRLRLSAVLCLSLAVAAVAGCGGDDDKTTTATVAAKPAYCADATNVRLAVDAFKDVKLSTGVVDELRSKLTGLQTSVEALRKSAKDEYRPQLDAVNAALKSTGDTVSSMKDPSSIPAALAALPGDVETVTTSVSTLIDDVDDGCK
jgi:hypothetical protein